jgi:hypothetical protein
MLLITCCLAKDDAVGTWVVLHRPRGVIHITWEVIDRVGLNWLFVRASFCPKLPLLLRPW